MIEFENAQDDGDVEWIDEEQLSNIGDLVTCVPEWDCLDLPLPLKL